MVEYVVVVLRNGKDIVFKVNGGFSFSGQALRSVEDSRM